MATMNLYPTQLILMSRLTGIATPKIRRETTTRLEKFKHEMAKDTHFLNMTQPVNVSCPRKLHDEW